MLIPVNAMDNMPSPLNLPGDLTLTTAPDTPAPAGMATTPCTVTACASEPLNGSPLLADLEVMVLPMRTTMLVPAGITSGGGGGGGGGASAMGAGAGADCPGACCCPGAICCAGWPAAAGL